MIFCVILFRGSDGFDRSSGLSCMILRCYHLLKLWKVEKRECVDSKLWNKGAGVTNIFWISQDVVLGNAYVTTIFHVTQWPMIFKSIPASFVLHEGVMSLWHVA